MMKTTTKKKEMINVKAVVKDKVKPPSDQAVTFSLTPETINDEN